jgi:hypothetical protein
MKSLMRYAGLALAGLLACEAGADTTLCIHKKTGRVRAVQTGACKGREEAVKLADPAAQPTGAIQVYDANNQFLGLLTGSANPYGTSFYIPSLQMSTSISMNKDLGSDAGDIWERSGEAYFTSRDCSGTAYKKTGYAGQIFKRGGNYYINKNKPVYLDIHSETRPDVSCFGTGSNGVSVSGFFQEDTPSQVTLPFQTPVALPLQFRN